MRTTACPRLFEVEAMRDGRLTGSERVSFERHMTVCAACSREAEALDELAEALRARAEGGADVDELHVRRERTRLLAAFDRSLVAPERRRTTRDWMMIPAAVLVLAAGLLAFWRMRPVAPPVVASSTVVHAEQGAQWSKVLEGNRDKLVLDRGALWIHVGHAPGEGKLLVVLPDGELEDLGTTFTVVVEDGHTTRVVVEEGRVVLRLRGAPPVTVEAGGAWTPEAHAEGPKPAVSAFIPEATPSEPPAPAARSAPSIRSAAPSASASAPDPSEDFRVAMAAFDRGDSREAANRFASFLEMHPRDPRAEDAAYLRVFALRRCGDERGMKEAAREYLTRYPQGFRRAEVGRLSE
jgi:hypothetical protein